MDPNLCVPSPADYFGPICMHSHPCKSEPCQNNGTCEVDGVGYTCRCLPGWRGHSCEKEVRPVGNVPCERATAGHFALQMSIVSPSFWDNPFLYVAIAAGAAVLLTLCE